jgi:sarcosine oxidase
VSPRDSYAYAVVGCGGLGSAITYWLSRRAGADVVGLEQFELGHVRGGSQDHSRIIRSSYHDPIYTALTPHTFGAWREAEEAAGLQLVFPTGGVMMGAPGGEHTHMIDAYEHALAGASIPFERVGTEEITQRWPQFRFDSDVLGIVDESMGLVDAGKGTAVHQALARANGATILEHAPVDRVEPAADGVQLHLRDRTISAHRVVIAAGAWADRLVAPLGRPLKLRVTQEQVTYYRTPNLRDFAIGRFPTWLWQGADALYGFPIYGEVATKVSIDLGGPDVTAETRDFVPDPERERRQEAWLARHLPGALGPVLSTKTCLYDMTPDRNFVLDRVPEYPQVLVAAGAGHAFKFAALIGRIMSELAIDGSTSFPVEPFRFDRPALTDPDFVPSFRL